MRDLGGGLLLPPRAPAVLVSEAHEMRLAYNVLSLLDN